MIEIKYKKCCRFLFLQLACLIGLSSLVLAIEEPLVRLTGDQFIIDLRYAKKENFFHQDVYQQFGLNQCYVDQELLAKIESTTPDLKTKHLKLVFFDCFRPLSVQRAMWKLVPDARYVANPKTGSNHNRGVAVDVGLAQEDGQLLEMPTEFDDFSEKAGANYPCPPAKAKACENRELLKNLLTKVGLKGILTEWWHFELPNAKSYPLREMPTAKLN